MSEPKQTSPVIDAVYYRDGVNNSVGMRVLRYARQSMFDLFMREMQPTESTRIIDIGTSDEENEGANFLQKQYPWRRNITCAGIGNGEAVRQAYPEVMFQRIIPGQALPFADGAFDIACSNAVLEHVGGREQRQAFIEEHLRVARAVFLTVPNRWFPIEHHTSIPFLHYSQTLFRKLLKDTRYNYWVDPANMDFLDRALLRREWPRAELPRMMTAGLPLGPLSSNIAVVWRPR